MRYSGAITAIFLVVILHLVTGSLAIAALDADRYISIDEVKTEMDAYCLTVFSGSKVEKFALKILSIVRGTDPGLDMILVEGVDERFKAASAVHGCSGSPVFIDGRMAGALAAGWDGSLDSLYLVRPIENMLRVGSAQVETPAEPLGSVNYDYSNALSLETYYSDYFERFKGTPRGSHSLLPLSCTLPQAVCREYDGIFQSLSMLPVASGGLLPSAAVEQTGPFEPGGVLALVLCGGDISITGTGTVTEILDDQLFGFGHSFRGEGKVNLPIASGVVHTVVASRSESFKLSSPGPILGTLEYDQSAAVRGTIGKMPKIIDLDIEVDRFDDPAVRHYDCYLAVERNLTPLILQMAVEGAVTMPGALPFEHTVKYVSRIELEDGTLMIADNVSSGRELSDMLQELVSVVSLALDNPFGEMPVKLVDVKVRLEPKNMTSNVWEVDVSEVNVRPGQSITLSASLRSYQAEQESVSIAFTVPQDVPAGKYKLNLMGAAEYRTFLSRVASQRFSVYDLPTLKKGLTELLQYPRNRLYAVMQVPSSGLVMRQHELGNLPPTKMLLMQDPKRLRPLKPYQSWAENSIETDTIITGTAEIEITVEN